MKLSYIALSLYTVCHREHHHHTDSFCKRNSSSHKEIFQKNEYYVLDTDYVPGYVPNIDCHLHWCLMVDEKFSRSQRSGKCQGLIKAFIRICQYLIMVESWTKKFCLLHVS